MIPKHIVSPMVSVLLAAVALLAGCAQMQAGHGDQTVQLAARNCKAVPADFVGSGWTSLNPGRSHATSNVRGP